MTFEHKLIVACTVMATALLYFALAYINERKLTAEICAYIHRQVIVLPYGARSNEAPYGLEHVYNRCVQSNAISPQRR
ncbi:hypothetical protein [Hyphomicrobium sp. CS1GBMeth3]|uniref:hypothetical protein n=1 Tax=Hyphomicrobium sp. CS1GBMeth3 TaxID=1892845 RepID=UPI0009304D14|nr:hypothetical protein [Hyphomicrobium sp. CS1GBMeth3]